MTATNAPLIRADPLQKLHTMHNLAELLGPDGKGVPGVVPTLRDTSLQVWWVNDVVGEQCGGG